MTKETRTKGTPEFRTLTLEPVLNEDGSASFVDEATRTVTLSFSSTEPVTREYVYKGGLELGNEVLSHNDGAIDTSRLLKGAPLLVAHDKNDVVGVIENVWVSAGKGFAQVRFSRSARATEIFNDVVDSIRQTVSVGYRVLERVRQDPVIRTDLPTYLVTRWLPFEISLEPIAADLTVGVGRASDDSEHEIVTIEDRSDDAIADEDRTVETLLPVVEVRETRQMENMETNERELGIKGERKRISGINKTADQVRHILPDIDALAEEFKNSERTLDEFNEAIVARMDGVKMETLNSNTELGLSTKEKQAYSFLRMVEAQASGKHELAGYEKELSDAVAQKLGTSARGFYVPFEVLSQRADAMGTAAMGAGAIPTNLWTDSYIDVLRAKSVCVNMGVQVIEGVVGKFTLPKSLASSNVAWNTETGDVAGQQFSAGTVSFSPKEMNCAVGLTRSLTKQAGIPSLENYIINGINNDIAAFVDGECLLGNNANGFSGVARLTVGSRTGTVYTACTWDNVLALESAVATANAEKGALGYIMSPVVRGILKGKLKSATSGAQFIMDGNDQINGYKCATTSNCAGTIVYGNWNDALLAMWGGIDILVDPYSKALSGGLVIRGYLSCDFNPMNTASFASQGFSITV